MFHPGAVKTHRFGEPGEVEIHSMSLQWIASVGWSRVSPTMSATFALLMRRSGGEWMKRRRHAMHHSKRCPGNFGRVAFSANVEK
jgi:hypothetical protein